MKLWIILVLVSSFLFGGNIRFNNWEYGNSSSTYYAKVVIKNNPYIDTLKTVKHKVLAEKLSKIVNNVIDSKKWYKGDKIYFIYTQTYLIPKIKTVIIKRGSREILIFVDKSGRGHEYKNKYSKYTKDGTFIYNKNSIKQSSNSNFILPLKHIRITSKFTYRRWHPILKRYRPHHGTDFGARRGTPLYAINSGKIIYAGWMGGYGKVVKIKHSNGYESLYAHQSRIRVKKGQRVRRGQVIGYIGTTGRSTGPHLHLGLKRYGRWVDPMKVLKRKFRTTNRKYKNIKIKNAKRNRNKLKRFMRKRNPSFHVWSGKS